MRTCLRCGRAYPEVAGAEAQRCPFCGQEAVDLDLAPQAEEAPLPLADPVGALAHAGRFVARSYPRLLALWLPVVVMDATVALAIVAYQAVRPETADLGALTVDQALSLLGVISPLYFLDFAVTFAAWSWVARAVMGPPSAARGSRQGASLGAAVAMGALLTLALVAGFLLALVPSLVLFHMFLFAPAALAAGSTVGGAFEESRRFARERRTAGFTALMVLLAGLLVGASFALGSLLQDVLVAGGVGSPVALALAEALPGWLLWPLLPVLPASYWLLAREAGARDAEAHAMAAGAATTRRSTKCPKCGALVPYDATGGPVDVTCPLCGTSGRVL